QNTRETVRSVRSARTSSDPQTTGGWLRAAKRQVPPHPAWPGNQRHLVALRTYVSSPLHEPQIAFRSTLITDLPKVSLSFQPHESWLFARADSPACLARWFVFPHAEWIIFVRGKLCLLARQYGCAISSRA